MTVDQLIAKLKKFPGKAKIYVSTGSDCYGDPNFVTHYEAYNVIKRTGKNAYVIIESKLK